MKNTTRNVAVAMSVWVLSIASLALRGFSSTYANNFSQRRWPTQAETYEEFILETKGTKLEGKISKEKFNTMKQRQAERNAHKEKMDAAIQSHDFNAWKKLMNENNHQWNNKLLEKIDTQEKFEKLIQMHSIMEEAKTKVETIREELGLEQSISNRWIEKLWSQRGEMGNNHHPKNINHTNTGDYDGVSLWKNKNKINFPSSNNDTTE